MDPNTKHRPRRLGGLGAAFAVALAVLPGCAGEGASDLGTAASTTAVYARNLSELDLDVVWTTFPGGSGTSNAEPGATVFLFETGTFLEHPVEIVETISLLRADTNTPVVIDMDLDSADWTRSGSEPYQAFTITIRDRDFDQ